MHYSRGEYTSTHAITYSPSTCAMRLPAASWILNRDIIGNARPARTCESETTVTKYARRATDGDKILPSFLSFSRITPPPLEAGTRDSSVLPRRDPRSNRDTRNNGARIGRICETVMNKLSNARLYTAQRHTEKPGRQTGEHGRMWGGWILLSRD